VDFPTAKRLERPVEEPETAEKAERSETSVVQAAERVMMDAHTPACVIINRSGEILHFHGRTGKYLEPAPGAPTTLIADMAREGLRFALLSALRRVDEAKGEIREKDVRVKTNHAYQRIDLVVKSFSKPP
jgi:two-component system CheB/CheR fusion protein